MDVIAGCARPVRRHARHFRRRTQSGGSGHVDALGRTEECLPCKAWATHLPVIERFRFARSSFKPAWKTTNGACWSRWSADDTRRALRAAVSDLLERRNQTRNSRRSLPAKHARADVVGLEESWVLSRGHQFLPLTPER